MTQSVELLLDDAAERLVLAEWDRLADAGLPTERRLVAGSGLPVLAATDVAPHPDRRRSSRSAQPAALSRLGLAGPGADAAPAPTRNGETRPSPTHRPHVTLWAGPRVAPEVDAGLAALVSGLALPLVLGSPLLFGPRRGQVVLVRQVVVSAALLDLQRRVSAACGTEPDSHFAPGRWTPHVTLARRVRVEQLGAVVQALGDLDDVEVVARTCRRWDGDAKVAWTLAPPPVSG